MKNFTLTLFLLCISFFGYAEVSTLEREALIKLNQSTNGSEWKIKWDLAAETSTWYGVKIKDNKVVGLALPNNNLEGQIPTEISQLQNLETLNLFKNKLSGNLPLSIGDLKSLQTLNISFNKLSGAIPATLVRRNGVTRFMEGEFENLEQLQDFINSCNN